MSRKAGILMPIFSLPSNHYIGDFGKEAYKFIDIIKQAKFKIWQILPLNPVGYGNSPYQPYSSYAGEEIYISIDKLKDLGLIKEIEDIKYEKEIADYEKARSFKLKYFKEAFNTMKEKNILKDEFENFKKENFWVNTYATFITLKKKNDLKCWLEWDKEDKCWIDDKKEITNLKDCIEYEMFVQFLFYKQWFELKRYANEKGIEILGDIPIYVGIDSVDVWENKENFLLDEEGNPTFIAGVPPDYFSKTGQRWGNPIYDWDYLKNNDFKFWLDRLSWSKKIYDIIRIDHFRAFDTYWKIPSSCDTAIEGEWIEAPGYALFDKIYEVMPDIKIVAEDLGDLRPQVLELRDHYKLSGMKILQFELDPNETNNDFKETERTIMYTGTHDNQTLKGAYNNYSDKEKQNINKMFDKYEGDNILDKMIYRCFDSVSNLVVIPTQDILNIGDEARINTPSTIGSPNWEWKLNTYEVFIDKIAKYGNWIIKTNRA
ncbi:4-alpha-glucanotransferase [uncultured Tyzzerella sp.]|uniref:4-alpha-glucanotransferase n=1 Tax=uncultured Tyzzerella sp. TaxID=2321398 RepID=UPI0029431EE5|nr:4-alpha-glucanotransferase [uncultured Tyzzerella sp.]